MRMSHAETSLQSFYDDGLARTDGTDIEPEARRLPPAVALPVIGALSLGLWMLIYEVINGARALLG
jgi:hypothetical protein